MLHVKNNSANPFCSYPLTVRIVRQEFYLTMVVGALTPEIFKRPYFDPGPHDFSWGVKVS